MAMTTPSIRISPIILDTSADWDEWLAAVQAYARARRILPLIDITQEEQPAQQAKPLRPTYEDAAVPAVLLGPTTQGASQSTITSPPATLQAMTSQEREIYRMLNQTYKEELAEYEKEQKGLQDLVDYIYATVTRANLSEVQDRESPWELILALKRRLAPSDRARKLEISRHWNAQKKAPRSQQTDKWLSQWQYLYTQAKKLKIAEVQDNCAVFDFVTAVKAIDPDWANPFMVKMENKELVGKALPDFNQVVELFRHHQRLIKPPTKATTYTALATLQGEEPAELPGKEPVQKLRQQQQSRQEKRPPKECACGDVHYLVDCPYLIDCNRPAGWVGDVEKQRKADQRIASSKIFREIVEKKRATAEAKIKGKQKASELHGENAQTRTSSPPLARTSLATAMLTNLEKDHLQYCWILDSAATTHVCNSRDRFVQDREATEADLLYSGLQIHQIEAFGHVTIIVQTPIGPQRMRIDDVALVTGYLSNLVSTKVIEKKKVYFNSKHKTLFLDDDSVFCYAPDMYGHYVLEDRSPSHTALANSAAPRKDKEATASLWHATLGHPNHKALTYLEKNTNGAVVIDDQSTKSPCETCHLSKAHHIVSRRSEKEDPAEEPLARVAFDLIQMNLAYNNDQWISHFHCYYTGYDWAWTHAKKSQTTAIVQEFLNLVETQHGRKARLFRTDGETSLGNEYKALAAEKGMSTERSAPYTPAQNGAAERSGGVIVTRARCMRIASSLPSKLWPEIILAAVYLGNRTPREKLGWKTPYEKLHGKKPSLSHLHMYGCRAYPLNQNIPRKQKLEPRAHIGYLVGYDSLNIFRIWVPSLSKVIRTRDVTFDEGRYFDPSEVDLGHLIREGIDEVLEILEPLPLIVDPTSSGVEEEEDEAVEPDSNSPRSHDSNRALTSKDFSTRSSSMGYLLTPQSTPGPESGILTPNSGATPTTSSTPAEQEAEIAQLQLNNGAGSTSNTAPRATLINADLDEALIVPEGTKRSRKATRRFAHETALALTSESGGFHTAFALGTLKIDSTPPTALHRDTLPPEPRSWYEMKKHRFAAEFIVASGQEVVDLERKQTYQWIKRSEAKRTPLPLKWVFKYKFDTDGYLMKFKARLCVRGDLQATEHDTYAATLAARTFRALMAIAAAFDLEVKQYDAVNAFANCYLDEEIYCMPPQGHERLGYCWRLLRALYGLKQSPLLWYNDFTAALEELGLDQVPGVNCLFANDHLIVFFFVDDVVVLYSKRNRNAFEKFEKKLLQRFEMRVLGDLEWFLGVRVTRDRTARKLWLCQDSYITKIAARYGHADGGRPPKTPLPSEPLIPAEEGYEATAEQRMAYQQRVGSLNFAAVITRADVAFTISKLSQFLKNPTATHRAAADRAIAYLVDTYGLAIEFSGQQTTPILHCSSDAAFADDPETRRSSDGYLVKLYGGAIDWKASRQKSVTISSTEAELLSISTAAREVIWWERFFKNIQFDTEEDTHLWCDNTQTIGILQKEALKLNTKLRHVDVHQHWLREKVQEGTVKVKWMPTAEMPADGLTKALPTQQHAAFVKQLNLVDISSKLRGT